MSLSQQPTSPDSCPTCDTSVKKQMKKPALPIRILLQVISLLLSILLFVSLLSTAALIDLRVLTSSKGIEQLLNLVTSTPAPTSPAPSASHANPSAFIPLSASPSGTAGVVLLNNTTATYPNVDIPAGIDPSVLSGGNAMIDALYEMAKNALGEDIPISKEQVEKFVEESTVSEFLSEEVAALAGDILNGTETAEITTEEIMTLIQENKELIEETFEIELTEEAITDIEASVTQVVEEQQLNETIRAEVNTTLEQPIPGLENTSINDIMLVIGTLTQPRVIFGAIGICIFLILLLGLANYYHIPTALSWASASFINAGLILSTPLFVLEYYPNVLLRIDPNLVDLVHALGGIAHVLDPEHYGILVLGLLMAIGSIVWKVLLHRKKAVDPAA